MDTYIVTSKIFLWLIIVVSAVFHEYMHAWVANALGDPTAKRMGRLTLNPIPHLDLWWTVIIPLALLFLWGGFIGMAKPVPYNPYNLRSKYGEMLVGLAGPATNLTLAILLGLVVRGLASQHALSSFADALVSIVYINIFLALFNLIPVPPLDGSKVLSLLFPKASLLLSAASPFGLMAAVAIGFYIIPSIAKLLFFLIMGTAVGGAL